MYFRALWLVTSFVFVSLTGPLTLFMGQINASDPSDLYLLLDRHARAPLHSDILQTGAVEIGPEQARFARMIFAPRDIKALLLDAGYLVLPAGPFAALCGFASTASPVPHRNG